MMSGDTYAAAQKAAKKFKDKRVKQFFDPQQLAGRAFAKSLGHSDQIAWDIYFFYPVGALWQDLPPRPETFMHQLRGRIRAVCLKRISYGQNCLKL